MPFSHSMMSCSLPALLVCHLTIAFQEMLPYIVMRSHDADWRPVRRRLAPCTASELPVRFRGCWRVRAHARPGSRARGTRDRTIGTLADPFELAARGARCAECSSCPGADAGGRAPAKPRALTPTRPRVVLAPGCVRRRGCSRTPSLNRARAPRAPPRQSADWNFCQPFFFPPVIDGWSLSRSRAASEGARQKTHRPSAVACRDSA